MGTIRCFEDLEAWKRARRLVRAIYSVSGAGAFRSDLMLRDQIRRAAVSVLSNIAEGFERESYAEFRRFLAVAKGSAGEVRAQLYIAIDQGYIDEREFFQLSELAAETSRLIKGMINYLNRLIKPSRVSRQL